MLDPLSGFDRMMSFIGFGNAPMRRARHGHSAGPPESVGQALFAIRSGSARHSWLLRPRRRRWQTPAIHRGEPASAQVQLAYLAAVVVITLLQFSTQSEGCKSFLGRSIVH
jgi:hypothetical protein